MWDFWLILNGLRYVPSSDKMVLGLDKYSAEHVFCELLDPISSSHMIFFITPSVWYNIELLKYQQI